MTGLIALVVLLSGAVPLVGGARVGQSDRSEYDEVDLDESGVHCCCKQKKCEVDAKSDDEIHGAIYSPQHNLCCKNKTRTCENIFAFSGYKITAPSPRFCQLMVDEGFNAPITDDTDTGEPVRVEDLEEGSPEHTVHTYCELGVGPGLENAESDADTSQTGKEKGGIVKALVQQLSENSIDSMAKEIFSLYVCVRWAPSSDFVHFAEGEIATGQLDNGSSALEHYSSHRFMPLRCSKNVNVYGDSPQLGQTHFDTFEAEMEAISKWYTLEAEGTLLMRLEKVQSSNPDQLVSEAALFDIGKVTKELAQCPDTAKPILVNVQEAPAGELLGDCGAARWWLQKLRDWHSAMPFTSFMMPNKEAASQAAPKKGEQALVCFGKRVASQLHRREEGKHLMTDQSMVGCHGFWKIPQAAKMLDRIVRLWRPPTCQLAAMELDMKMKIMDVMATMNTQLFDALPAMLVDEMSTAPDWDGKALQASHGLGIMRGVWSSIVNAFSGMKGQYTRLGQLLGDTVVKWVVCPLKPISDPAKIEKLDMALGTEDDLSKYYAKQAYAKWTGAQDLLPGEACTGEAERARLGSFPGALACSLGIMQENTPEPYKDREFLCPVRPLLPAKQQLDVFRKKPGVCMLRMSVPQMMKSKWFYRGRTPQRQQYNVTENLPAPEYQGMKVMDMHSRPDTDFAIWRTFVTIAHRCTEEEERLTPRWCQKPRVENEPSAVSNLLGGLASGGGAVASVVRTGLEAGGVVEKAPSNKATKERLGGWLYGKVKGFEKWVRSSTDKWLGRASARYSRLHTRLFTEVEAAELLHSASFQAELEKTGGDSKDRQRFDRYAVVVPCQSFDPSREFHLKYVWGERAISLARKAHQKFADTGLMAGVGAFHVRLRGDGVLSTRDASNAWMTYFAHLTAANAGATFPGWIRTDNPYLQEMTGAFAKDSDAHISASSLLGFQATFACGSRTEMHDLPPSVGALPGDFSRCVKEGKESNDEARRSSPDQPFLKDEIVIRVTFTALDKCYKQADQALVKNANETVNPVFKNFFSISGCEEPRSGDVPEDVKTLKETDPNYRGMLFGRGLPVETLAEVLIDPEDFLMEVKL